MLGGRVEYSGGRWWVGLHAGRSDHSRAGRPLRLSHVRERCQLSDLGWDGTADRVPVERPAAHLEVRCAVSSAVRCEAGPRRVGWRARRRGRSGRASRYGSHYRDRRQMSELGRDATGDRVLLIHAPVRCSVTGCAVPIGVRRWAGVDAARASAAHRVVQLGMSLWHVR